MRVKKPRQDEDRRTVSRSVMVLLLSLVAIPVMLAMTSSVASAAPKADNHVQGGGGEGGSSSGGIAVTSPNTSECSGGGLKLDGIDDKVIPNGTYSTGTMTIVISDSTIESGVLSFTWTATQLPAGKTIEGVVIKGGDQVDTDGGGLTNTVTWTSPPWYSHISWCLTDIQYCPGTTTEITDATDDNSNGIADMCETGGGGGGGGNNTEYCPGTTTVITDETDQDGDGLADMCEVGSDSTNREFCPGTTLEITDETDQDGDGLADMCQPVPVEVNEVLGIIEVAPPQAAVPAAIAAVPELPRTGVDTRTLVALAMALIALGLLFTRMGRHRRLRS